MNPGGQHSQVSQQEQTPQTQWQQTTTAVKTETHIAGQDNFNLGSFCLIFLTILLGEKKLEKKIFLILKNTIRSPGDCERSFSV